MQSMILRFHDDGHRVTGLGADPFGVFDVIGAQAGRNIGWTLEYVGGQTLFYVGHRRDGDVIWGSWTWEGEGQTTIGKFRLWPVLAGESPIPVEPGWERRAPED